MAELLMADFMGKSPLPNFVNLLSGFFGKFQRNIGQSLMRDVAMVCSWVEHRIATRTMLA